MNLRFALPALLLVLAAADGRAQKPTTGDPETDLACLEILGAKSEADLRKLAGGVKAAQLEQAIQAAENEIAVAQAAAKAAEIAFETAKKQHAQGQGELSGLLTSYPRLEDYREEEKKIRTRLSEIKVLEQKYNDAKADLDVYAKATPGNKQSAAHLQDLRKAVEIRQRLIERANKAEVEQQLTSTVAEHNKKEARTVVQRAKIPVLEKDENIAKGSRDKAQQRLAEARADRATLRARQEAITRCARERRAQLDPDMADRLKRLDEFLAKLERAVIDNEAKAKEILPRCAKLEGTLKTLQALAVDVGRSADALAAKARTPGGAAAAGQQRAAGAKALSDAQAAAATIAKLRAHANQASQAACRASQTITAKPADPAMRAVLVEVQRHRAEAEHDVTMAAAQLDVIRAAHAAAPAGGTAPAAPGAPGVPNLAAEFAALKERVAELGRQRAAFESDVADMTTFFRRNLAFVENELQKLDYNARNKAVVGEDLRAQRIADLLKRATAINTKCLGDAAALAGKLDIPVNAAGAKVVDAETALGGAAPPAGAVDYAGQIDAIFKAARADADAVAADATNAVRCETAARTAMANPPKAVAPKPPDPPKPADPPKPSGDMLLVWGGTWKDASDSRGEWTIGNTTGGPFAISAKWQGNGGPGHTNVWNGTCTPKARLSHEAFCTGRGVYNDEDKETSFGFEMKLNIYSNNSDGMSFAWKYVNVSIRMKKPGMAPYGSIQNNAVVRGSIKRVK